MIIDPVKFAIYLDEYGDFNSEFFQEFQKYLSPNMTPQKWFYLNSKRVYIGLKNSLRYYIFREQGTFLPNIGTVSYVRNELLKNKVHGIYEYKYGKYSLFF